MSSVAHPPTPTAQRGWVSVLRIREMWASLAIGLMWVAVAVSAVWGPDLVSYSSDTSRTSVPSGIAVAMFASIGTWAMAKYALGSTQNTS